VARKPASYTLQGGLLTSLLLLRGA